MILEAGNLQDIIEGQCLKTPDGTVLIGYTPDIVWLADQLMDSDGDPQTIGRLIDQAAKRPQKGPRPHHPMYVHRFDQKPEKP